MKTKTTLPDATSFLLPNTETKSRSLKKRWVVGRPGGGCPNRPQALGTGVAEVLTNAVPTLRCRHYGHPRQEYTATTTQQRTFSSQRLQNGR
ncbi:hypothetical protein, partial [Solidesulfovibrio sp.]|uniref:hypothetical protein n=1 Tax=Solidesulfovibrio sp. TaxID=2910990 RepID=UPI002B218781